MSWLRKGLIASGWWIAVCSVVLVALTFAGEIPARVALLLCWVILGAGLLQGWRSAHQDLHRRLDEIEAKINIANGHWWGDS